MTARPSVIELRTNPREAWWVATDPERKAGWRWVRLREFATVFPTVREAERFRVDHCLRFLSGYERRSTRVRPAEVES